MVVYVTYRVRIEVELEIETGEIMDVHIVDERHSGRNAADRESPATR